MTPDQTSTSDSSRPVSAEATGFEADLCEALPEGLSATVRDDGEGSASYVLGSGEVSVSREPERVIELDGGGEHHVAGRLVVEDHTGTEPRTVISSHDNETLNGSTARRAVEHYQSVQSGSDPLTEAHQVASYPPHEGLPASYGFDLLYRSRSTKNMARELTQRFEDEHTEVSAYDSGGGNEIIGISGSHPQTGSGYEVMVSSRHGGSLHAEGWAVGADYQEDGEWGHSDLAELYETGSSSDTGDVAGAVDDALSRARAAAGM